MSISRSLHLTAPKSLSCQIQTPFLPSLSIPHNNLKNRYVLQNAVSHPSMILLPNSSDATLGKVPCTAVA
jgi:hypothetical protein